MSAPEKYLPRCGLCAFFDEQSILNEKNEEVLSGMGFCHAKPPGIHMTPVQGARTALQQQGMTIQPRNYRPAVTSDDLFCQYFIERSQFEPKPESKELCDGDCGGCDGCGGDDGN